MKALKGLLIYIGIALAILAGIGIVLFAIMFFFPGFKPFGIGLINYNKIIEGDGVSLYDYRDYSNFELNINSKDIDVYVVPVVYEVEANEEKKQEYVPPTFDFVLKVDVFGFTNQITEFNVVSEVSAEDDKVKMVVNVSQPNGLITYKESYLNVYVPEKIAYNLIVNTKTANTVIGGKKYKLNIKTLSVNSESGDLSFVNMSDENKSLSLDSLNVSTKTGYIDFSSIEKLNIFGLTTLEANQG